MLEKLAVTGFKSLREVSLEFGQVNLFIGGNGSGKSNLLEALGMVASCLDRGVRAGDIHEKGVRATPPELVKSSFKDEKLPKYAQFRAGFSGDVEYTVSLSSSESHPSLHFRTESLTHDGKRIFGRSPAGATFMGKSRKVAKKSRRGMLDRIEVEDEGSRIPASVMRELTDFYPFTIYAPQTDILRGVVGSETNLDPVGVRGENLTAAVRSFTSARNKRRLKIRKKIGSIDRIEVEHEVIQSSGNLATLPGWAKHFGTRGVGSEPTSTSVNVADGRVIYFEDKFMNEKRKQLSTYDSSEGTLFLLFAAIIVAHPDSPKIFALDNVDNSLNPRITRKLIEQIIYVTQISKKHRSQVGARQVFLTSHNPTALDAFDLFDPTQRVFVVRRNDSGHTVVERLEVKSGMSRAEWTARKRGRNLSQLWLDGEIPGALGPEL